MTDSNVPPWSHADEEIAKAETELDDSAQHGNPGEQLSALIQLVRALREKVGMLDTQFRMMPAAPARPDPNILQRGKYIGKTRDWVVENAPDYIIYLRDSGYLDKWPFTAEQVAKAAKNFAAMQEAENNKT